MSLSKMQFAAIATVGACFALAMTAQAQQAGGQLTPIRPPAVPLIVRSPYVSTWQPANALPGTSSMFWAGRNKSITGIARVDGHSFIFMGNPRALGLPIALQMTQTGLAVTPTQSNYQFQGGGVAVLLDFLSPVEPTDLRRMSVPLSYIFASARSADGKPHTVSLYFDVTGEWAHGDENAQIIWERRNIPSGAHPLTAFAISPAEPKVLGEVNEYPMWGSAVFAAESGPGLTTQAGEDTVVRGAAISTGKLDNSIDTDQPRPINNRWPVFAFSFALGQVGSTATKPIVLSLGDVRDPAVSYQKVPVPPLWRSYWADWPQMLAAFDADSDAARTRADRMDTRIVTDATKAGGAKYAAICTLALRQAFGATEMVGTSDKPWMFMKEISSDGNMQTIDIMYPAFPVFLYASPTLLRLQLDPLFDYAESGKWPQPFAEHDIGASYPNADGHNDGQGENMPVEESANMLIMAAAYMRYASKTEAAQYAKMHYKVLKQWTDYLLTVPAWAKDSNALDPEFQNQTDDFTGPIAHSVNLALKGILGVGAMGQIASYAGNTADASKYSAAARDMIGKWARRAQSQTGDHLTMQYIEADTPQKAGWAQGIVGSHALLLSGGGGADAPKPAVDTSQSYTVAAWVKLSNLDGFQTLVSIDGAHVSGFFLQLRGDTGKLSLSMVGQDSTDQGAGAIANANEKPAANTWYHLAGVYDAAAQTISLYVNGVLQQTVPYKTAFRATGRTAIGRGFFNNSRTDYVRGAVDDVRFYQSALPADAILAIARDGGTALPVAGAAPASMAKPTTQAATAYWTFDEGLGTAVADASGNGNNAELSRDGIDPNDAWSLKYNAFPDKVLNLNLVPQNILKEEAKFYKANLKPFGIPLDIRHTYTKTDWEIWTAASTDDPVLRQAFVDGIYKFTDTSNLRVPFTDWYDAVSGQQQGFQARPAIGGVFAILDRTALKVGK
ncbi:MAG: glutaminase domain-containing protein [Janthinobacterium lividum]